MRRKVRIFSTIVSLALVLAVMCVGIWAASSVTLSSTGTLTFNPTDVNATVAFADAGGTKQVNFGQESYSFDETTTAESHSVTFTFAEANKTTDTRVFTVTGMSTASTVTVTNTFAAGSDITIDSKLTATVSAESNFEVEIKVGEEAAQATEVVTQGTPVVYTITVSVKDSAPAKAFTDSLNFSLNLTQTQA